MTALKVVDFPTPEHRDPARLLRKLADEIDSSEHGEVATLAVAMFADGLKVFGGGPDSDGPTCALLFSAAAHRFAREIEEFEP